MALEHIAIIMDGNGRWAKNRGLPRVSGHVHGVKKVREIIKHCLYMKLRELTLFAFGRDNWKRPESEVSFLMKLLYKQLDKECKKLHAQNVKIRFIGDRSRLSESICSKINFFEELTQNNTLLHLNIAIDYSGTYDIVQAVNKLINNSKELITEEEFTKYLLTYPLKEPDLLIRTGGESRISNFMLWQLAYTELYFTNIFWPDFGSNELDVAIKWFFEKERRYGQISEQLTNC